MTGKTAFIVGSGQIGRAAAARLASHGWRVRVGHREGGVFSPDLRSVGVEEVFLDREKPGELARALGAGADAIIDTVTYTPEHAAQLLAVQAGVGAFVVISSCSVYRDESGRSLDEARQTGFPDFGGPIVETRATVDPGSETYSTRKVAMEQALAAATTPVAILRPGAIHGPGCNAPREWWFVKRALDGRTRVPLAYDGMSYFHTTAAANIAEAACVLLERREVGVFNIGDPEALSVREIGEAIGGAMDHHWTLVGLPKHPAGTVGATPWSIPRPILIDTAKLETLGYSPVVSYGDAVAETCDDLIARTKGTPWVEAFPGLRTYPQPWFDYAAEDDVMA